MVPLCEEGDKRWPEDSYFLERLAGHCYRRLGDLDAGRSAVARLLARFPDNVTGFELGASDPEGVLTLKETEALKARIERGDDGAETRGRICFVLFEHWHRQGYSEQAFAFLQRGNELIYGTYRHKPNDDTLVTTRTIKTFDARFFEQRRSWGDLTACPIDILDVDCDQLVGDLDGTVRSMLDYCDLPFEAACLDFHESTRGADTASWAQVHQPIFRSSIGAWRVYEDELAPLSKALTKPS